MLISSMLAPISYLTLSLFYGKRLYLIMKPKESKTLDPDQWVDPIVKLLSYASLAGKVSKKQRQDRVGVLKTIEISTNMNEEQYDRFLDSFVTEGQKLNKKAEVYAHEENEKNREIEDSKQLPKGFVSPRIFNFGGEE